MHARFAALFLCSTSLSAQVPLWQRPIVLPVDTSVRLDLREALAYTGRPDLPARMDMYRPAGAAAALPGVILVHGGPTGGLPVEARRLGQYTSLGRLLASRGFVAITFTHRLTDLNAVDTAAADARQAIAYVISHAADLGVDPERLCLWSVSGGGVLVAPLLRDHRQRLRCFVAYYSVFTPAVFQAMVSRSAAVPQRTPAITDLLLRDSVALPPTFVVRAGKDNPRLNADLDGFVTAALSRGTDVELHAYAEGRHAFDILDDTMQSRDILLRTVTFLERRLSQP